MKGKILALFLGFAVALSLVASAQRTGGFPSRPMFQAVTISTGTRAGTGDLRINSGSLGIGTTPATTNGTIATESASYNDTTAPAYRATFTAGASMIATPRVGDVLIGTTTAHPVLFITNSAARLTLASTGTATFDSGTTGNAAVITNANANGPYISFSRSGTAFGDIGNGPQIGGGGVLDDFAIGTRGTGDFIVATGASIASRLRIDDAGATDFFGPHVEVENTSPYLSLNDTDSAANNRLVLVQNTAEEFLLRFCSDGIGSCTSFLTATRTANTADNIDLAATTVTVNSNPIAAETTGTFTGNVTGCSAASTISFRWTKIGNIVLLEAETVGACTSNATGYTINDGDFPAAIRPASDICTAGLNALNNGASVQAAWQIQSDGGAMLVNQTGGGAGGCVTTNTWTNTGTKRPAPHSLAYSLN